MKLKTGDSLCAAGAASESNDALMFSSDGQAIRFNVGRLRVASRSSGGVRGMKLRGNAHVVALAVDADGSDILVVTKNGLGKRTAIDEYPTKGRGGMGVQTFRITDRTGEVAVAANVKDSEELLLITIEGVMNRQRIDTISQQGRATQGVQVVKPDQSDYIAALAKIYLDSSLTNEPTTSE